jgi:ParB family chromosome partitioning protein
MGERRWRAARLAGLQTVPAIVRTVADSDLLRDALLENLHREQLNALEEAAAYAQLLDDFSVTHEALSERVGKSRSHVSNTLRLLGLTPPVQRRVAAGVLSAGHARAILGLSTPEAQERMAERVVAEGLSVRGVEEAVSLSTGQEEAPARKKRRAKDVPAEFGVVAERLAERFETRVKVDSSGKGRGRVVIEFAGLEDLQRILDLIDAPSP